MGPYSYETCELIVSSEEYDKILKLSNTSWIVNFIIKIRKAFVIPDYKEIKLKVEN